MANVVKRSVSFSADTWELIEEEAARTGTPASTIINDLVRHRLGTAAWQRYADETWGPSTPEMTEWARRTLAESRARRAAWASPSTPEP